MCSIISIERRDSYTTIITATTTIATIFLLLLLHHILSFFFLLLLFSSSPSHSKFFFTTTTTTTIYSPLYHILSIFFPLLSTYHSLSLRYHPLLTITMQGNNLDTLTHTVIWATFACCFSISLTPTHFKAIIIVHTS